MRRYAAGGNMMLEDFIAESASNAPFTLLRQILSRDYDFDLWWVG
jgi:hypothetical protein